MRLIIKSSKKHLFIFLPLLSYLPNAQQQKLTSIKWSQVVNSSNIISIPCIILLCCSCVSCYITKLCCSFVFWNDRCSYY